MAVRNEVEIELDEWRHRPEDRPQRTPTSIPHRWRQQVYAVVCAVVVLAATGASAAPASPPSWRQLTDFPVVDGQIDTAAGLVLSTEPGTGATVARRLADGGTRWRADLRLVVDQAWEADGALLVSGESRDDTDPGLKIARVDPADGTVRWQRPGILVSVTPDGRIAVLKHGTDNQLLSGIDMAGGAQRWSFDAGQGARAEFTDASRGDHRVVPRPGSYFLARRDGSRVELHLDTGTADDLGWLPPSGRVVADDSTTIVVEEPVVPGPPGQLYEPVDLPVPSTVAGYDRSTRQRLWRSAEFSGVWQSERCGELVCLNTATELRAVRPRTGEQLWAVPGGRFYTAWHRDAGDVLILTNGTFRRRLVDAATGEVRATLPGWQAVGVVDGRLVVWMADTLGSVPQTWLGVVLPSGDLVVRVLGMFGPPGTVVSECRTEAPWLLCTGVDRVMAVRIPATPAT
ncbi:hypothetical protein F4553_000680 [Allocatelliglobosispora scoriae]|uniref:Uncharacterized protein n=1 Tax=Allocatelliglobosispora scoriae TaxID=643052 RepID=A0A841BK93_9ACTN|nr:PQQ-binding-like beta-propeller repeat protein [Allocatelliglobosispora scoriae]MBB5867301.1 hypothetical protein [Allocatelliglobosispora scoriae]